ncbi:hypothetical protein JCM10369A_21380 [Nocardioides pyridinolyticus]
MRDVGLRVLGPVRVAAEHLGDAVGPRPPAVLVVVPGHEVEVLGRQEGVGLDGTDPRRDGEGRLPVDEDVAEVEDDPGRGGGAQAQRSEAGTNSSVRSPV